MSYLIKKKYDMEYEAMIKEKSGPSIHKELRPYSCEHNNDEIKRKAQPRIESEHDPVIRKEEIEGDSALFIKVEEEQRLKEEESAIFKARMFLEENCSLGMKLDMLDEHKELPLIIKEDLLSHSRQEDAQDLHHEGNMLANYQENDAHLSSSSKLPLCLSLKEKLTIDECNSEQQMYRLPLGVDLTPDHKRTGFKRQPNKKLALQLEPGERPFICHICNKSFSFKSDLTRHMRMHTGESPFLCNICNKRCKQKSHLENHMLIHTGQRPFTCQLCKKSYTQKAHLIIHDVKAHSGTRSFMCPQCSKSFTFKSELARHLRMHTGERPFICHLCNKSYAVKTALTSHIKIHSGENAFTCHLCNKSYTQKAHLKTHMKTHTNCHSRAIPHIPPMSNEGTSPAVGSALNNLEEPSGVGTPSGGQLNLESALPPTSNSPSIYFRCLEGGS